MRLSLFIGGVFVTGLSLAAVACGSSESTGGSSSGDGTGGETNASSSGGSSSGKTSSSSSSSGSSGSTSSSSSGGTSSSGGLQATELAKGFASIVGIAGDQVVYQAVDGSNVSLNAVPIGGGAATKISDMAQGDRAVVRGGAVGVWKSVTSGIGTFNVWTKAAGLKAGPGSSIVGLFAASKDGARIAFSVAATSTTSRLAVVDTANVTAATTYNGGANAAAALSNTCLPDIAFAGTTFVGAYCTGSNTKRARLVTMAGNATTFDSTVSDSNNANGIQPYFQLNKNETKVLVLGLPDTETGVTQDEQLRIVTLADGATQVIDTDVYDGALTDDGSEVVYQTGAGAMKRASTGATPNPVEIVPAGSVKSLVSYTSDLSRVLFASTDEDANGFVDLETATLAAANTPALVASGVLPLGVNATDSHFLWVAGDANGASLKAKPVAGGAEKDLFKDPEIALIPPSGAAIVVGHDSKDVTLGSATATVYSLTAVTMAGAATLAATDVPEEEWAFKDNKLVFSKLVVSGGAPGAGSGIFAVTLP